MTKERSIALIFLLLANGLVAGAFLLSSGYFEFADPEFFWVLPLVPGLSLYHLMKGGNKHTHFRFSHLGRFVNKGLPWKIVLKEFTFALKMIGVALIIFALARPQDSRSWEDRKAEGIDIIMALDVSASMLAQDFKPDRLEASKEVAMEFINSRPDDRIGLVIYEGESFTQVPLTTDHTILKRMFSQVRTGMLEGGTAIGMGLATAVSRLKDSEVKSKVVILLSDGENTSGAIQPLDAAQIAQTFGIRVYTIGVGTQGYARSPVGIRNGQYVYDRVEVKIDEETLTDMATLTGGQYFRATNRNSLEEIYKEIDRLEKTRINVTEYSKKTERYYYPALLGLLIVFIDILFTRLLFRYID